MKAYIDNDGCCNVIKDYNQCQSTCEDDKLTELKDNRDKHYSKDVKLTGTHYEVTNSIIGRRRRRLLQKSSSSTYLKPTKKTGFLVHYIIRILYTFVYRIYIIKSKLYFALKR